MKKSTIWGIAIVMGISFLTLLYLQFRYFEEVVKMRQEQITESVNHALYQTSRALELNETHEHLKELMGKDAQASPPAYGDTATQQAPAIPGNLQAPAGGTASQKLLPPTLAGKSNNEAFRQQVQRSYLHHKGLIEEEMLNIIYEPGRAPLKQRLQGIEGILDRMLRNNGINDESLIYHYCVINSVGDTVSICQDYDAGGNQYTYRQILFPNDPANGRGILYIHFPTMQRYIYASVRFMMPAIVFTLVLLCMFIFTVYTIFRQKRYTEMKNDFINNMTHEFKTPISTISLAAQMLQDPAVGKSERMFKHLSTVIGDETKRLRFQVEKVLQMSLFDQKGGTFSTKETTMNSLLEDVANTFRLKVETANGSLTTDLKADNDTVVVDPMHITNVVFNLLDNAVKYKHPDRPLEIEVHSENHAGRIIISVSDNGIGIKRDDLKKIFGRFYRAHTGNRHDVKGFGLGLAYVKKVVDYHHGTIHAESVLGRGTKFVVTLPLAAKE